MDREKEAEGDDDPENGMINRIDDHTLGIGVN
jgi:hypothetical protein